MRFFIETVLQLVALCALVYLGGQLIGFLFE
jgi:hypothetical protein